MMDRKFIRIIHNIPHSNGSSFLRKRINFSTCCYSERKSLCHSPITKPIDSLPGFNPIKHYSQLNNIIYKNTNHYCKYEPSYLLSSKQNNCHNLFLTQMISNDSTERNQDGTKKLIINPLRVDTSPVKPLVLPSKATLIKEAVLKKVMPKKPVQTVELVSTERNFITAVRAMSEFLLKPSHLEDLRKTKRRSPFDNEPRITVYWRKEVENKAIQVWGTRENLEREKTKRERELKAQKNKILSLDLFNFRRLFMKQSSTKSELEAETAAKTASKLGAENIRASSKPPAAGRFKLDTTGKVVYTAVAINGANFVFKFAAWMYTGSQCLFAEALHSLADTTNQLLLVYGIHKSTQSADSEHPYGFSNMRYVSSLLSGAMIFFAGGGASIYHGISGLIAPPDVVPLSLAFYILGGSLVSEGATLIMAIHAIRKGAIKNNMTFFEYVKQGEDPSVNVVLLEDAAAVTGVGVAITCLGLTSYLGSPLPDALGSCIIGCLLASVSYFIIRTNITALVGRSIPPRKLEKMNQLMEQDLMIRALHDVKGIDMGAGLVRYKAEVDIDGRELTRAHLTKTDLNMMVNNIREAETYEEAVLVSEAFCINFGENVVESLGGEIDRIEKKLKKTHPEVRHIDLEIL